MSSTALNRLAAIVLADLAASSDRTDAGDINKSGSRTQLDRQQGQILVINRQEFLAELKVLYVDTNKLTNNSIERIWEIFTSVLRNSEATFTAKIADKEKLESLREVRDSLKNTRNFTMIVNSYAQVARTIKKSILGNIVVAELERVNKGFTGEERSAVRKGVRTELGGSSNRSGFQPGHGDAGIAVAGVRGLRAQQLIEANLEGLSIRSKRTVSRVVREFKQVLKLKISRHNVIDNKGRLLSKYIPILTFQRTVSNQEEAIIERKAVNILRSYFEKNMATQEGSASIKEAYEQALLSSLAKKSKGKKVALKLPSKPKTITTGIGKSEKTSKMTSSTTVTQIGSGLIGAKARRLSEKEEPVQNGTNYLSLLGILKAQINATVAANMTLPALVYRTGRFAASVNIIDVTPTAKGFPSVGYTYMKSPYQVFEMGLGTPPWATPDRDPRAIIDKSIREIASDLVIGRLFTRRV